MGPSQQTNGDSGRKSVNRRNNLVLEISSPRRSITMGDPMVSNSANTAESQVRRNATVVLVTEEPELARTDSGGRPPSEGNNTLTPHIQSGRRQSTVEKTKNKERLRRKLKTRFPEDGDALKFLKKVSRKVMHVLTWISVLENVKDKELDRHLKSFTDLVVEYQFNRMVTSDDEKSGIESNDSVNFDKSYFKASRDINLSSEIKEFLTMHPESRTKEMCQKVVHGLQLLKSFADYPLHIQEKLSAVVWYTTVSPKRTVIRQGHQAENFYFILSGQALVKLAVVHENTGETYNKTVAYLKRDDCFGEMGLLYKSRRSATVESATYMEMLVVQRFDFLRIFMNAENVNEEAEHITFCRHLEFLRHWPVDRLLKDPRQCMMSFFRRNAVISADSETSDHIYIIKSGTVQVLKHLQRKNKTNNGDSWLQALRQKSQSNYIRQPYLVGLSEATGEKWYLATFVLYSLCTAAKVCSKHDKPPAVIFIDPELHALMISDNATLTQKKIVTFDGEQQEAEEEKEDLNSHLDYLATQKSYPTPNWQKTNRLLKKLMDKKNLNGNKGKIQFTPAIQEPPKSSHLDCIIDDDSEPLFLEVALLQPKDVFGLHNLVFQNEMPREQPRLSIVSRGAEVIMLSKRFYLQHMNEKAKQYIRENVRPYPVHSSMQKKLNSFEKWNIYKNELLNDHLIQAKRLKDLEYSTSLVPPY